MESDILVEVVNKAGGVPNLAKLLNIKDQAVRQWIDKSYIPPKRHSCGIWSHQNQSLL